jgi:hypothetical protein
MMVMTDHDIYGQGNRLKGCRCRIPWIGGM